MATEIMVLGSSHAELPLVEAIHKLGGKAILVSGDSSGLANEKADRFIECDYSDQESVLKIAESINPKAVLAGCNDFAALSASYVAEKCGLPGHDNSVVARKIHLKDEFRDVCTELGIRSPEHEKFTNLELAARYMTSRNSSQIVKPNDLTGGKGISVVEAGVDSKQSLEKAFGLSRSGVVVVEEFITGTLHSAAIVLVDKTPKFLMLADERSLENPFLVSSAETPTVLDELVGKEVSECVEQIAQHLSLTDGLVHVQFIYDGNKPWIIEICRRPPGDLYLDLVEFSTGFSLAGSYLQQCLGMSIEVPFGIQARPFLRQCVMSPKNGWVENFIMSAELSSAIVERVDLRTLPARIVDFEKEKLAILFCGFDDPQWTSEMSKNIRSHIDFVYG